MSKISQIFLWWRNCPHLTISSTQDSQNHIPSSDFHIPLAQGLLLSLILHHISQKSHPRGEGPSAWWELQEHNLLTALERIGLPGCSCSSDQHQWINLPKVVLSHTPGSPRFTCTASGAQCPGEALECSLHLVCYHCMSCVCRGVVQIQLLVELTAHVNNICTWFSRVSPGLPGCYCSSPALWGTALGKLPRAGHRIKESQGWKRYSKLSNPTVHPALPL